MDDILAMLLAFSAKAEELDILMLSLTFGNVEVQKYVGIFFLFLVLWSGLAILRYCTSGMTTRKVLKGK